MRLGRGNFGLGGRRPLKWDHIHEGGAFHLNGWSSPMAWGQAWGQYRLMEQNKVVQKKKKC